MASPIQKTDRKVLTQRIALEDGRATTVHTACLDKDEARPRVVLFDKPTRLLDWCEANGVDNAINGGFFGSPENDVGNGKPAGELWIGSQQLAQKTSKFDRGCIYIDADLGVQIGLRSSLPTSVNGDLLEAGPLLLEKSKIVINSNNEGFSAEADLFDSDVTVGRAQRVAVACNDDTVWFVVSEGRSETEAGLTLQEMAEFLLTLGAKDALNLDGGSAASLVIDQKLINKPRMDADKNFREFSRGREIVSALVFDNN